MCIKLGPPTKEKIAYKLVFQEPDGTFISISTSIEIKPGKIEDSITILEKKTKYLNEESNYRWNCWSSPFEPEFFNPAYLEYTSGFKSHISARHRYYLDKKYRIIKITFKGKTRSSEYSEYKFDDCISGKEIKSIELVNN